MSCGLTLEKGKRLIGFLALAVFVVPKTAKCNKIEEQYNLHL